MIVDILEEPELEFGANGRHVDVRFGLVNFGPLDVLDPSRRQIHAGLVGTHETVEGIQGWMDACRHAIPGKRSRYPNLFPGFPGFNSETAFQAEIEMRPRSTQMVSMKDVRGLWQLESPERVDAAVGLLLDALKAACEKERPDVLVCSPPMDMWEMFHGPTDDEGDDGERPEFHDLLKAKSMELQIPIQLVWPYTYDQSKRPRQIRRTERLRGQQDEATRAWNFLTALYYKAGGTPWRLVRESSDYTSCSVGVSFYESLDAKLHTSMAQVFNERGHGVIVRGAQAAVSKEDRQPHLTSDDSKDLMTTALRAYRREHGNLPARVVVHKTSRFTAGELEGFSSAINANGVGMFDLLSIGGTSLRLFREGPNPPLRGTLLSLDEATHCLYTRGSVDFFKVYPGMYIPSPIQFRCELTEQTPRYLANEIMTLTKMNWNTTQFDGRLPITTRAARQVGAILKYVPESSNVASAYSFYM